MNQVFISYKNTINNLKTVDAIMARHLFDALSSAGINTFFAEETLISLGVDKYKERIDEELDQCKIMIVVGTSISNITSNWVKYEWDGFYLDILNGRKIGKVYTYLDSINPHDLPRTLRSVQSFNKKTDSVSDIVKCVKGALLELENHESDISEIEEPVNSINTSLEFSKRFLHSGATKIADETYDVVLSETKKIATLFDSIYRVKHYDKEIQSTDIATAIYEIIVKNSDFNCEANLLKIKGPLGSYKNRLIQYIYLLIEKEENNIVPFYIDLSMYEKSIENRLIDKKSQLKNLIKDDFICIEKIIKSSSDKLPVIIIDGIRDFSSGQDKIYTLIKNELSRFNCRIVVSLDTDFTNTQRFAIHPLAGSNFEYFIRIESMTIYNRDHCLRFISDCINCFNINLPRSIDSKVIYSRLCNLNIVKLDAYWISNILTEMMDNVLNNEMTIADLYEAICKKSLDSSEIDSAAELAYQYEYGTFDFSDSDYYFDKRWKIIRKHRSVMDYLIARHYVLKFKELQLDDKNAIDEQLHFFSMILPKSVTVFVSPMINKDDIFDRKILKIAKGYYDNLSVIEKNQLIFLLGRLHNKSSIDESKELLKKLYKKQMDIVENVNKPIFEKKKDVFLLRTLSVSLIVLGEKNIAKDYYSSLMFDKLSNEINRSFHLIYYGDQLYIPNRTLLDFTDNLKKGKSTFETLCFSIQQKIDKHQYSCMLFLELFTLCSLIQARVEVEQAVKVFAFREYIDKISSYINHTIRNRAIDDFEELKQYFIWMEKELQFYSTETNTYSPSKIFSELSELNDIKREGWVQRGIQNPENVMEHMYRCWLIAMLYLPKAIDGEDNYNKEKIMNILLVHDFGERTTGDIVRSEKIRNLQFYENNENRAMSKYLFAGTYPSSQTQCLLRDSWNCWHYIKDINFLIAKDIDDVQAIYQLCKYYSSSSNEFEESDLINWLNELNYLRTEIGMKIAKTIIVNNSDFSSIINKYGGGLLNES